MNLNLSKFRKIKEDAQSATLQHPGGHQIRIAKKILNPEMSKELANLPMHLAEGTDSPIPEQDESKDGYRSLGAKEESMRVAQNDQSVDFPEAKQIQSSAPPININIGGQPQQNPNLDLGSNASYDPQKAAYQLLGDPRVGDAQKEALGKRYGLDLPASQINQAIPQEINRGPMMAPQSPESSPMPLGNTPQPQGLGLQNYLNPSSYPGTEEVKQGLGLEAQAQGQLGKEEAGLYQQQGDQFNDAMTKYQSDASKIMTERESLAKDYANGHIDPKRLFNSMGPMGKIGSIIGIMLGGMGQPFTGHNTALEMYNKLVDQDISAQEAEMGKKKNLLAANMDQFHSLNQAANMTRLQNNDYFKSQIDQAVAKTMDPMARARLMQMKGQIDNQSAQLTHGMVLNSMMSSGQVPASMQGFLPPDLQQRSMKLPNGTLGLAVTKEEADKARNTFNSLDNIQNQLNSIHSTMDNEGRAINPFGEYANFGEGMKKNLVLELNHLHDLNRLNDYEFQTYMKQVPSPGDWNQGASNGKIKALQQLVTQKRANEMNNFLVGANQAPSNPQSSQMAPPNLSGLKKK